MSKDFSKRLGNKKLNSLIPTSDEDVTANKSQSKPTKKKVPSAKAAPKPSTSKTTVATFRIKDENLLALKALAFWERQKIQDTLNSAIENYLESIPAVTLKKATAEYKKRKG